MVSCKYIYMATTVLTLLIIKTKFQIIGGIRPVITISSAASRADSGHYAKKVPVSKTIQ